MISIHGTYQNGAVVLDEPVNLPEGAHVQVMFDPAANGERSEQPDICCDGTPWDDSPEGRQKWLEWFDSLEPIMTEEEFQRWEAARLAEREVQKALAVAEGDRIARMFP
ncbi:MAG: hypothetical protein ABI318_21295 [Chthoniobacteraceae bacterium]